MNIAIRNKEEYLKIKQHFNKMSLKIKNKRISLKCKIRNLLKKYPDLAKCDNIIMNNVSHSEKFIFKKCSKFLNCKLDGQMINDFFKYINFLKEYNTTRKKFDNVRKNVIKNISSMLKTIHGSKSSSNKKAIACLQIKKLFISLKTNVSEFINNKVKNVFIEILGSKGEALFNIQDYNIYGILISQLSKPQ